MRKLIALSSEFEEKEMFDKVVDVLRRYFVGGGAHVVSEKPVESFIYIYSFFKNKLRCEKRCERRRVDLCADLHVPRIFYDWDKGEICDHSILIYVNNRFAGQYCPAFRILSLTDWTHNEECVQVAKELFPKLFRELKISPLSKKSLVYKSSEIVFIGSDPEFEELEDWSGYRPVPTRFSGDGEIGADGAGSQIELRPAPAPSAQILVKHIKKLIQRVSVPVSVKGDRYPLGCHIHFGIPEGAKMFILKFVELLDDFLGKQLLDLSGRARGSYRRLGAYEEKPWGFEYRSLPSAVIMSPGIARIVFKIARNVVKYLLEKGKVVYQIDDTTGVPTERDYRRIAKLTTSEYSEFNRFLSEYSKYQGEPINANWVKVKPEYQISVCFRDDWDQDVKFFVKEWLERRFRRSRIKRDLAVHLFGLKAERGEVVYGFSCRGFKRLPDSTFSFQSDFIFGIPARLRFQIRDTNHGHGGQQNENQTAEEIFSVEEVLDEIFTGEREREKWVEETKREWERILEAIWREIKKKNK